MPGKSCVTCKHWRLTTNTKGKRVTVCGRPPRWVDRKTYVEPGMRAEDRRDKWEPLDPNWSEE